MRPARKGDPGVYTPGSLEHDGRGSQGQGVIRSADALVAADQPATTTVGPFDQDQHPEPGPLTGRRAHAPVEPSPLCRPAFEGDVPPMA
ncbi:hypothetical protein SGFS_063320 [Streptomyces graminofaciens]|uniref:Uncharacterized protein n=1 Tax=Streptomyces graminofaciens TaxID=68212 RepID=A0ABM7FFM0_9ACTN|nr:hypothetical protein SGFS_063320 [Streptomyces graminofaciens]